MNPMYLNVIECIWDKISQPDSCTTRCGPKSVNDTRFSHMNYCLLFQMLLSFKDDDLLISLDWSLHESHSPSYCRQCLKLTKDMIVIASSSD